jgi:hypothetical protein
MKCTGMGLGSRARSLAILSAAGVAAAIFFARAAQAADTLLYSFETLYNNATPPAPDPTGTPDAFQPNDGGIITQDTFGATDATHSLKYVQNDTDTFTGFITTLGSPFTVINDPTTTAISVDLTVRPGEEFAGGFASLGITEFGTYQDPDLGTLTGQAQPMAGRLPRSLRSFIPILSAR